MLKPIRALLPAGLAHIATLTADVTVGREYTKPKKLKKQEYLDGAAQIFEAPRHGCSHPELARPSQHLIGLIISNYTTDFACFCSVVLGGEGESMKGI